MTNSLGPVKVCCCIDIIVMLISFLYHNNILEYRGTDIRLKMSEASKQFFDDQLHHPDRDDDVCDESEVAVDDQDYHQQ